MRACAACGVACAEAFAAITNLLVVVDSEAATVGVTEDGALAPCVGVSSAYIGTGDLLCIEGAESGPASSCALLVFL